MTGRSWLRLSRGWIRVLLPVACVAVLLGGGGLAAFETETVPNYGEGVMWALSLMTTVGFVGGVPSTVAGKLIAAVLMLFGFALLALVTATVSSLFVREDEAPAEERDRVFEAEVLATLQAIEARLDGIEQAAGHLPPSPARPAAAPERRAPVE